MIKKLLEKHLKYLNNAMLGIVDQEVDVACKLALLSADRKACQADIDICKAELAKIANDVY